jgi:hypothetical protein
VSNVSNEAGKKDMTSAIRTIVVVNGALCLTLAGTGYFSVNSISLLKRPYVIILLHATLLFAMIGFCVSTLKQLGVDPTTLKPSDSAGTAPATSDSDSPDLKIALGLGGAGFALGIISLGAIAYMVYKSKKDG